VSVNSPESSGVSSEEEKEGYDGKDLQARKVLSGVKEGVDYGQTDTRLTALFRDYPDEPVPER